MSSLTQLLLLGQGRDLASERGVSCEGEMPEASDPTLRARARAAKEALGERVMILGHHYQRDEVIEFADIRGDSFKLAQAAAEQSSAEFIIFCGVHFMAESADILTGDHQKVILPDLAAGCSMADMATAAQVDQCWSDLKSLGFADVTVPVTYMNSSAAIKSFTGENGGTICTSSNAEKSLRWAFAKGEKVLFLPDQHLGRNTAVQSLGLLESDCVVWNPWKPQGGLTLDEIRNAKMILWRGHCSVHGRFTVDSINGYRERIPEIQIIVHPECQHDVVKAADVVGSTEKIIRTVTDSAPGTSWAVGTELNLVNRLANENPDKNVYFLDRTVCYCSTMNRIDLPHLVWALESLVAGDVVNQIKVDEKVAHFSRLALEQMLAL
jgi:quinolinate synthase